MAIESTWYAPRTPPMGPLAPPNSGIVLAGDAEGPIATTDVVSITPVVGGDSIPLDDFTSDPTIARPVVRQPGGGPVETITAEELIGLGYYQFEATIPENLGGAQSVLNLEAVIPWATFEFWNGFVTQLQDGEGELDQVLALQRRINGAEPGPHWQVVGNTAPFTGSQYPATSVRITMLPPGRVLP
jgi:hypothetical protein